LLDPAVIVGGHNLDLSGLEIMPGLINAHDHLHFALFPQLGNGPYSNATEWARDIYLPEENPVRQHLQVPKELRLLWGGLRNLLAGVTTVSHHDAWHPVFEENFPVRVVREYGWAHSLEFTADVRAAFDAGPPDAPFLIHLGEGTDASAAKEIFQLGAMGALRSRTVLIHAVGLTEEGWKRVAEANAAMVWCPRSNVFTLGRTIDPRVLDPALPYALGTDSPITAGGDLLDELRFVRENFEMEQPRLRSLVGSQAERVLRLPARPNDWIATPAFGEPPELVVIGGEIRLISPRLGEGISGFSSLQIEGRPRVLVRENTKELLERTSAYLGCSSVILGGRRVGI
jgi:cytosine/adenosine deaminase-related metal-dependent hydrolase